MPPQDIIVATDIGTRKVVVLVAKFLPGKPPQILGTSEKTFPEKALLRGVVIDEAAVSKVLQSAFDDAEREVEQRDSSIRLQSTYLSLSGGGLTGMRCIGNATVKASSSIVNETDVRRAVEEARKVGFGELFTPVVRIRQPYFLDGRMCPSPVGQMGKLLRASFWMVGAPAKQINTLVRIVGGRNFTVNEFIVSGAASGTVLARDSDREDGVLIVDIGAGATDYILYRRGAVLATGVLPVGGDHITHDLNIGLRVQSLKVAEKIKHEHDPEVLKENEDATVATRDDNPLFDKRVPVRAVETIITARLSEIFDIIKKRLLPHVEREKLRSGVILTGGTSQLKGINEIAKRIFEMEVRQGELADWVPSKLAHPQYSTVLGVLYEGWAQANKAHRPPPPPRPKAPKKKHSFLQTLRHILSQ